MINVNDLYRFVQFIANKEQSGFITPEEFNLVADRAQMQFFMERYNNPAEYQPGRPVPRVAYQQTQKVSDDLREFITRITLNVPATGLTPYPGNYVHFSSATNPYAETTVTDDANCEGCKTEGTTTSNVVAKMAAVRPIDDNELQKIFSSNIVYPDAAHPILVFYDNGMQFYPIDIGLIQLTYLRRPVAPIWGFTLVNGRPVYAPANSVDLEWPEQVFNEIAIRMLAFIGINLREADLAQYSETKRQTGV
tara:strand:- start:969 stop:1718 length:750 start_codon:yes stop_codon:yes gene_type:complete